MPPLTSLPTTRASSTAAGSALEAPTVPTAKIRKPGGCASEGEGGPLPRADSPAERSSGSRVQPIPAVQSKGVLATETFRRAFGQLEALYDTPLAATRTGALYNAFSYPTKISPETIALFIATHTLPGDTVLDVFAGSGTTGLAAKLCAKPTERMLALSEEQGIQPVWGPRHAELYDIGVLPAFLSKTMSNPPDPERFRAAAEALLSNVEKAHGWLYETVDGDGEAAGIRHMIWTDFVVCPNCSAETSYWDAAVRRDPLRLSDAFVCAGCEKEVAVADCKRAVETIADPILGSEIVRRRREPVVAFGQTGKKKWQRPATAADAELAATARTIAVPESAPRAELAWGDLYRSGYHTGITHLHHFYTERNFLALSLLWDEIEKSDEDLRDALRLLVLSFNASHSTLMTRVVVKQNQKEFVLTGAQSGVLYVSGLPVEKNIFLGVRRKIVTIASAFELIYGSESTVNVVNGSSTALHLDDDSVDYVFTDPPFGDYIPYAEINQLNEVWLGELTDRDAEIIVSNAGGKDVSDYGELMSAVFSEVDRVLHDDGIATVVFHSAKAEVWRTLTDAFADSGLVVKTTSVLDKTQASFKQVVSPTSVKGDPLILLSKCAARERQLDTSEDIVESVLTAADTSAVEDERTRERLFSRFITRCLIEGVPVSIGAAEFYARVDAWKDSR
jgi:16S rRNA G966 N2-methylase RsmD